MRVRIALAEKGIPYRSRELESSGKPPDSRHLNPSGSVPMLIDGDDVVVGSLAILDHLCQRWPEPPLFPCGVGREAVTEAYQRIDALFSPHLPKIARGTPEERVAALGAVRRAMAELDAGMPDGDFLLSQFSVADLALASILAKLPRDWRPTQLGFDRLARWERAVMQRPTVREHTGPRLAMAG
jgi:glutathione S-transferase